MFVVDSAAFQREVKDVAEFLYQVLIDSMSLKNTPSFLIACNKQGALPSCFLATTFSATNSWLFTVLLLRMTDSCAKKLQLEQFKILKSISTPVFTSLLTRLFSE